jgi:hypothetical protein
VEFLARWLTSTQLIARTSAMRDESEHVSSERGGAESASG